MLVEGSGGDADEPDRSSRHDRADAPLAANVEGLRVRASEALRYLAAPATARHFRLHPERREIPD